MLRVKRSVLAQFNTQVNLMSAEMIAAARSDDLRGTAASLRAAGAPEVRNYKHTLFICFICI
jgi:hypothetical protein